MIEYTETVRLLAAIIVKIFLRDHFDTYSAQSMTIYLFQLKRKGAGWVVLYSGGLLKASGRN